MSEHSGHDHGHDHSHIPANETKIAIAAALTGTFMLAEVAGYEPGDFIHTIGDAHIYSNHMDQVKLQLSRQPKPLPQLRLTRKATSIFDFRFEDFEFLNYDPAPGIKAPVAV